MNYRKIIETAIECEKLEAAQTAYFKCFPELRSAVEREVFHEKIKSNDAEIKRNHDHLKKLVEETV